MSAHAPTPPRRRNLPLVAGAVAIVVLAAVVLITALGREPGAAGGPADSPETTITAEPDPEPRSRADYLPALIETAEQRLSWAAGRAHEQHPDLLPTTADLQAATETARELIAGLATGDAAHTDNAALDAAGKNLARLILETGLAGGLTGPVPQYFCQRTTEIRRRGPDGEIEIIEAYEGGTHPPGSTARLIAEGFTCEQVEPTLTCGFRPGHGWSCTL